MQETTCAYTGETFGTQEEKILSFDRVDNTIGYEPGNVIPVTTHANQLKSNYTIEELLELAEKTPKRHLGFVGSVESQIAKKDQKIQSRKTQIADLERLLRKDIEDLETLRLEKEKANAAVDSSVRDGIIYSNMAQVLLQQKNIGHKYMTRWQRFTHGVSSYISKFKFTLPTRPSTTL